VAHTKLYLQFQERQPKDHKIQFPLHAPLLIKQFGVKEFKLGQQTTWSKKTMKEHKSTYSHQWKAC
jgi:hypothetical protein